MGIKNLMKLIGRYSQNSTKKINSLAQYQNQTFAIDVSIFMHKFKADGRNNFIEMFEMQYQILQSYNIKSIYVFDGSAPKIKYKEINRRKIEKNKILIKINQDENVLLEKKNNIQHQLNQESIFSSTDIEYVMEDESIIKKQKPVFENVKILEKKIIEIDKNLLELDKKKKQSSPVLKEHYHQLRTMFKEKNIPFVNADGEAERTCVLLCLLGYADVVVTDDMDALAFGAPRMIKDFSPNGFIKGCEISLKNLEHDLNMNHTSFIDLCILCGCDYIKIHLIGWVNAYNIIRKFRTIDRFVDLEYRKDVAMDLVTQVRNEFSLCDLDLKEYDKKFKTALNIPSNSFCMKDEHIVSQEFLLQN